MRVHPPFTDPSLKPLLYVHLFLLQLLSHYLISLSYLLCSIFYLSSPFTAILSLCSHSYSLPPLSLTLSTSILNTSLQDGGRPSQPLCVIHCTHEYFDRSFPFQFSTSFSIFFFHVFSLLLLFFAWVAWISPFPFTYFCFMSFFLLKAD